MGTAQQVGSYRHIAPTIEILDCTLRDGEQTSGVSFMPHEKLMIARMLLQDIKVDRVEVASARVSEGERDAVKMICTKWPYLGLPDIRLHDSITLGSQAFLCHDGAAGGETISMLKIHARKPSQSGRSEPTAELAQPALSSRRAYIPAALTPDRPSIHFVTQSIHDMRLYSEGLYIPRRRDACRMTIS